jgi:hypothetical protein
LLSSVIRPGGYVEFCEIHPWLYYDKEAVHSHDVLEKWSKTFEEAMHKLGRPIPKLSSYKPMMMMAGFVEVREICFTVPISAWPEKHDWKVFFMALSLRPFTRGLGWSYEQVEASVEEVTDHWCGLSHGYQKL